MKIQMMEEKLNNLTKGNRNSYKSRVNNFNDNFNTPIKAKDDDKVMQDSDYFFYKKGNSMINIFNTLKQEMLLKLDQDGINNRRGVNRLTKGLSGVTNDMSNVLKSIEFKQNLQRNSFQQLIENAKKNRNYKSSSKKLIKCNKIFI
jgi:hypothetical protein